MAFPKENKGDSKVFWRSNVYDATYILERNVLYIKYDEDTDDEAYQICRGLEPIKFCCDKRFSDMSFSEGWFIVVKITDAVGQSKFRAYPMSDFYGGKDRENFIMSLMASDGVRFHNSEDVVSLIKALWCSDSLPFELVDETRADFIAHLRTVPVCETKTESAE